MMKYLTKPVTLRIDITADMTQEQLEYIFDCWTTFVLNDLGWDMKDAIMYQER